MPLVRRLSGQVFSCDLFEFARGKIAIQQKMVTDLRRGGKIIEDRVQPTEVSDLLELTHNRSCIWIGNSPRPPRLRVSLLLPSCRDRYETVA